MDPVAAVIALVLAASACYRTISGKREALTAGLWVRHEVAHVSEFVSWRPVMAGT
jgi:seryl-tRNA synthetase